jgi:IclR family pca regulon transcriptional regulator
VRKDEVKQYHLTPKVLTLGFAALQELKWREVTELILKGLYDQVHETINLGILSGRDVLYVIRLRKRQYTPFDIQVGTKLPLYCTALGKSLLAFSRPETVARYWMGLKLEPLAPRTITRVNELKKEIAAVKKTGYSINDQESAPGILALGCPVLDLQGFALMAINVTVGRNEYTKEKLVKDFAPKLLSTAREISKTLIDMNITQQDIGQ